MVLGRQIKLLLWKNFMLRKRQPFRVIAELLLPLILFLLLAWVKRRGLKSYNHECHFDGKPMPSSGPLPFFQGLICAASNTCYKNVRPSEDAGVVNIYNSSLMSQLFVEVQEVLRNESKIEAATQLLQDITTLQNMQQKAASGKLACSIKLGDVLINTTEVIETAKKDNISLSPDTFQTLFTNASLNPSKLLQLVTKQALGSSKPTDVSRNLRKELCKKDSERFFMLSDSARLDSMTNQLCQLDDKQFDALVKDVNSQVDTTELVKQLVACTENTTGKTIGTNKDSLQKNRALFQDLRGLSSLQTVLKTSNEVFGDSNTMTVTNDSAALSFFSRMFCGQESTMFGKMEGARSLVPQDEDDEDLKYNYDHETTPFCNELFRGFEETATGRIAWKQFKPMIRGWITYTPDTPAVRKIIKEANSTFEYLAMIKTAAEDWLKVSPNITTYLSTNPQVEQLKDSLGALSLIYPNITAFDQFHKFLSNETNADGSLDWHTFIHNMNTSMESVKKYLECFNVNKFKGYATEADLETASLNFLENYTFWAGLVFDVDPNSTNSTELPTYISYKIRIDTDHVDTTSGSKVMDRFWVPGPRASIFGDLKYIQYGFVYIQDMLDHGIIRLQTKQDPKIGVVLQQFPYPCYVRDDFMWRIAGSFPLFMTIAWIFTASMIVKGIVYEKEQRLKEVMKVMGLSNASHWLAWFITCFITMFLSVLLLLCVLKFGKLLENSDISVIFVFMVVYTVATISECFMFTVFFSKANVAAACAGIFYFMGYLPFSLCLHWEQYMSATEKGIASLSSTVAFGFGWSYVAVYEQQGIGMQWQHIASSPMPGDNFNLLMCMVLMLLDALIYGLITWYIEAVFPGEYGFPQPWNFMFTKGYWCSYDYSADKNLEDADSDPSRMQENRENFEAEPNDLTLGVSIRGLRKVYTRGNKVAVDRLTINFYEGQLTSFLGHNGAGKTTTMSILTGLFPQTAGTAYIYDMDIRTDLNDIRKKMGMCPQYNVLFNMLSVEEHLWFYSRLKGMDNESIKREMPGMIQDIGLPHKRHEMAKNLSGGMKRKMSVALAFAAGSQVVILDEPTAGVDPYSRKSIWDLLLKYKKGRTIIMSTHFMEEADVLGDRIAILSQGKLCCCGSSMFLKNHFGSGYYLTVARDLATEDDGGKKDDQDKSGKQAEVASAMTSHGEEAAAVNREFGQREAALTTLIHKFLPGAVLVEDMNSEITYQLPDDRHHTQLFKDLFLALDDNIKSLGFSSYGISDTTLEEVFLKVTDTHVLDKAEALDRLTDRGMLATPVNRSSFRRKQMLTPLLENQDLQQDDGNVTANNGAFGSTECVMPSDDYDGTNSCKLSGFALVKIQFFALLVKRFHYMRRSKKSFIAQIILPVIFVCLAMVFSRITPEVTNEPPLELHPWLLVSSRLSVEERRLNMFLSNDQLHSEWTEKLTKLLTTEDCAVGCRCMDPTVNVIKDYPCVPVEKKDENWEYFHDEFNETVPCNCSTGVQVCPEGAAGPRPRRKLLPTTDYLLDMTGRNISDWIIKTTSKYTQTRFGGLAYGEVNQMAQLNGTEFKKFTDGLLEAVQASSASRGNSLWPEIINNVDELLARLVTKENGKVWFNNKGYQSSVAYMNVLNNALLRISLPTGTDPSKYGISITNHPINRTRTQRTMVTLKASAVEVLISIAVIFAMSFIPAGFCLFLTEERSSNSKHLQLVSGVKPVIYWVATFFWDMVSYFVSGIICILIFVIFQQRAYVSGINAPCLIALILLYGWAITPLMYILSYGFKVPSSSFVALSCVNVFIGIITTISTFILELFSDPELDEINNILRQVFLVLPQFCLGRGLIDMTKNQLLSDFFATYGEHVTYNPFGWEIVGRNLFSLFILGAAYFAVVIFIEYGFWINKIFFKPQQPATIPHHEDIDVARERQRVFCGNTHNDTLTIESLTKTYRGVHGKRHPAVDNICLGVHKGECFGLLGVNGAGKTTTFKMLTGDVGVTSGDAHLCEHSILTDIVSVHQHLGYCPQFDALCPLLTGKEHLYLYARLRGVPAEQVPQAAMWALKRLNLVQHADKIVADYSGGNRRKLSTAIALVGNPSVIFLDEPSTGMDPKARRFLWKCISDITKSGRSVVLTSHSMEECEALCNRIAIMVNGTFQCLGSIQHLKNRFGNGYTVILHIAGHPTDEHKMHVIDFMLKTFPSAQLKEHHQNMLQYQLGSTLLSLAYIFGELEKARDWLHIEDYSVCQTTLDQVFINFAKNQTDLVDDELRALVARNKQANTAQRQALNVAGPHVRHLDNVLALGDTQNVSGNTFRMLPMETKPPHSEVNDNEVNHNIVIHSEVNHNGLNHSGVNHSGLNHNGVNHSGVNQGDVNHTEVNHRDVTLSV